MGLGANLDGHGKSRPHGFQTRQRLPRSLSLYRLRYSGCLPSDETFQISVFQPMDLEKFALCQHSLLPSRSVTVTTVCFAPLMPPPVRPLFCICLLPPSAGVHKRDVPYLLRKNTHNCLLVTEIKRYVRSNKIFSSERLKLN